MTDGQTDRLTDEHTIGPDSKKALLVITTDDHARLFTVWSYLIRSNVQSTLVYYTIVLYGAHLCSEMYLL